MLTGGVDKLILATEFSSNNNISIEKFIPWEYSSEGVKIKNNHQLDFSGNQITILINQLSTIFTKLIRKN